MNSLHQIVSIFVGALVMSGYFLFESILFGTVLWLTWNFLGVAIFFGLSFMSYLQAVGILFIIKILRFDSSKLESPIKEEINQSERSE